MDTGMKRKRSGDDEDSFSEHSPLLESNRREKEEEGEEDGFTNGEVSGDRFLEGFERSKRKRTRSSQTQPQTQLQTLPKIDPYKCSVCGKEYPSYQALGGHKAGHSVKPPQSPVQNASADAECGDKTQRKKLLPSGKIHKCSICHTVFPTGQALGGHKRLHYQGFKRSQEEAVSEGEKSSPSDHGSVVTNVSDPVHSPKGLIDLNKVPSPESDESSSRDVKEDESAILANSTNRIKDSIFYHFL